MNFFCNVMSQLRKTRTAAILRKPYRALFRRYEDNGYSPEHPHYYLRYAKGVIHVGANSGQECGTYAFFRQRVIWIEPIPEVFAELERNIARYPKQRAFCELMTDKDGAEYDFKVSNNEGGSSSIFDMARHKDLYPGIDYTRSLKLRSTTIDSFMRKEGVRNDLYDVLVLDTQGAELLVLRGAVMTLRSIRWVYAESADFELYAGCCQDAQLSAFLRDAGFVEVQREAKAHLQGSGTTFDVLYKRR